MFTSPFAAIVPELFVVVLESIAKFPPAEIVALSLTYFSFVIIGKSIVTVSLWLKASHPSFQIWLTSIFSNLIIISPWTILLFSTESAFMIIFLPALIVPPSLTKLLAVKFISPSASIVATSLFWIFSMTSIIMFFPAQTVFPLSL